MFSLGAVTEDNESEAHAVVRAVIGLGCAYEVVALATGRVPTLSRLCRANRWFEAVLLAWLLLHFHHVQQQRALEEAA